MEVMELEPPPALEPTEAMDTSANDVEMLNTIISANATPVTPILIPEEEAQSNNDVTDNKQAPVTSVSVSEEVTIASSVVNNKVPVAPQVSNTSTTNLTKTPVTLTKAELNKLISDRISKYLSNDTQIVDLTRKVMLIQATKDRLCQKLTSVQKQVQDLTSAMVQVSESLTNADETKTPPPPLRFFRSVGLQVNSDTRTQLSVQNSNIIRTKENAMPYKNGVIRPSPASIKRNSMRFPEVNSQSPAKKSVTDNGVRPEPENEIVDLTDEPKEEIKPPPALVTQQGPVQYRVVNPPAGGITTGMQLINTPAGLQLINTSAGQNQVRPVILQPISSGVTTPGGGGGVVLRNVNANSLVRKVVPSVQRPGVRAMSPNTANLNSRFQFAAGQVPSIRNQLAATSTFLLPPLPPPAANNTIPRQTRRELPPKPELSLKTQTDGIVLSWTHSLKPDLAEIITYQIYACQEGLNPTSKATPVWKRVGDVKALPLPMACTLSQFTDENRYHFIVRGVDVYNRTGPFCDPSSILKRKP